MNTHSFFNKNWETLPTTEKTHPTEALNSRLNLEAQELRWRPGWFALGLVVEMVWLAVGDLLLLVACVGCVVLVVLRCRLGKVVLCHQHPSDVIVPGIN